MINKHTDNTKEKIRSSLVATRLKRQSQDCRVYPVKIVYNSVNNAKKEKMCRVFLEAKWLKNTIIASDDISGFNTSTKKVEVKMPDGSIDIRGLKVVGAHMKQSIHSQIKSDLSSLKASKERGRRVGRLNFSKEENVINLKEYGNTYKIDRDKSRVFIQKIGWLKVRGLDNIPDGVEFSNAKFIHKPDGYYLHITTYMDKDKSGTRQFMPQTVIGIDMGLGTQITTSDGDKINLYVEESGHLRRLKRKRSRQKKGSNNYKKTCRLIKIEYQKINQRKDDYAKKIVSDLSRYELVFFQDENISAWKNKDGYIRGGKKIQRGILGRVKSILKQKSWAIMLPKNIPTTQSCPCGAKNPHQLHERVYFCSSCGYTEDRDVHAAKNMIRFGFTDKRFQLPLEQRNVKPAERLTSGLHFNYLTVEDTKFSRCSLETETKQEAHRSSVGG